MISSLRQIIDEAQIIQKEYDDNSAPVLTNDTIWFNGIEDDGHETFTIDFNKLTDFAYCKTARKPYDVPVCMCLLIIKAHFGKNFDLSSDGFGRGIDRNWNEPIRLVKEMGYNSIIEDGRVTSVEIA